MTASRDRQILTSDERAADSRGRPRPGWGWLALPLLVYLCAYLLPLGARPLTATDEVRYAEIPREMIVGGDWVVPRLAGVHYFEKPPLGAWAGATAQLAFGPTAAAVRTPAVLGAAFMALAAALLVCFGRRDAGLAARVALATLCLPMVHFLGTFNVLDALFSGLLSLGFATWFAATGARAVRAGRWWGMSAGVFLGAAFLTKGLLAFALPVLVAGAYAVWSGSLRAHLRRVVWPALAALVVVLPWSLWIAAREPDFWRWFVMIEHVERFTAATDDRHPEPLWYFLPVFLAGACSWLPFLPGPRAALRALREGDALFRYALCWALIPALFLSVSSGKLATYVLPCFPALAVLAVTGLEACWEDARRVVGRRRAVVAAGVLLVPGALLVWVALRGGLLDVRFAADERWKGFGLAAGFALWALALLRSGRAHGAPRRVAWVALGPLAMLVAVQLAVPRAGHREMPLAFLREALAGCPPEAEVVADDRAIQPCCWITRRTDIALVAWPGELAYGLSRSEARGRRLCAAELAARIADPSRRAPLYLIGRTGAGRPYWDGLPNPEHVAEGQGLRVAVYGVRGLALGEQ